MLLREHVGSLFNEMYSNHSPVGECGLAKRIVFKCFAKTDEVFLYAYFLCAQEIGERKRGGYAPRPRCRVALLRCDAEYNVSENNAFATKVGRKGCVYFLAPRGLFGWAVFLSKSHEVRGGFGTYKG